MSEKIWGTLWRHPFFPLALSFLILNLLVTQDGGQNAKSRMLPMRSFAEEGNFRMDHFLKVTDDWSSSPNGHYYSNKAPGPMILGMPVFFTLDKLHQLTEKGYRDERGLRHDPGYFQHTFTSFFMQALPFALLVLICVNWLVQRGATVGDQFFFVITALFANTAAVFFNAYFGHGFSALLQLAGLLSLLRRRYFYAGIFFSFAMLSDYSFAMQIPALLAALWILKPGWKNLQKFAVGAVPGAILWIVYHSSIFGSPFVTAGNFQNPTFVADGSEAALLGVLSFPRADILWELLFGASRGLVLSQPWLVFLLPFIVWFFFRAPKSDPFRAAVAFGLLSLGGLLLFNSSFNGWHGGSTPGPRYLSAILPCLALVGAVVIGGLRRPNRTTAWTLVGVGLVFRAMVYAGTLLAPNAPLWGFYWRELISRPTPMLRFVLFFVILGLGAYFSWRRIIRGPNDYTAG